mgnify:CR=1 FL=1
MKKTGRKQQLNIMNAYWFSRSPVVSRRSISLFLYLQLIATCSLLYQTNLACAANETSAFQDAGHQASAAESDKEIFSNHRMEPEESESIGPKQTSRQSRQYDAPIGASSTGNYAAISGDGGAYVAQLPLSSSNYGTSSNAPTNYASDLNGAYNSGSFHDPLSMARGYPPSPVGPVHHPAGYPPVGPLSSMFPPSFGNSGSGLLSGTMFPLMSKGFDVSEIVCTAIAVAIGAVIVGAPFILLYLFVMNQMNGNGPGMGTSGGAISLTGPTSSTTVSGRKKRHTSLPEALFKQLSPLVNSEQVASTFKSLMNSIAKYHM